MATRLDPEARKAAILDAAIAVAQEMGLAGVLRRHVADRAECSVPLISTYFPTVEGLKDAVMEQAVKRKLLPLVAQGLALRHPVALKAPKKLRDEAKQAL